MTDAQARKRFDAIQRRYAAARDRLERLADQARRRYGPGGLSYMNWSERERYEAADRAVGKQFDAMFALLRDISPRQWESGVAAWWVMERLTYDDAVTDGALSAVPRAGMGTTQAAVERFALAGIGSTRG